MLEQLAVVVAIALGRLDLRRRLEVQHALLRARVRVEPPGRADGQHEVVARPVAQRPEDRVADAAALVDEEHLVGHAVAVERALGHRAGRPDDAEHDVVVEVQRHPAGHHVAGDGQPSGLGQAMAVQAVVGGLEPDRAALLDAVVLRRRRQVVEQRRSAGEALDPEQLLGVERAVGRPVLGVALAGDAAVGDVVHRATGLLDVREEASLGRRGRLPRPDVVVRPEEVAGVVALLDRAQPLELGRHRRPPPPGPRCRPLRGRGS